MRRSKPDFTSGIAIDGSQSARKENALKRSGLKKSLAAVTGAVAAAILLNAVPRWEGEVLTTYYDPVGIATVCYGDTDPAMAVPGATYTREECLRSLELQLIVHAGPVIECLGIDPGAYPHQTAAFISLAYNIGVPAFCRSTAARRWRAGDRAGACAAISMWDKAGGKVLPGLVARRADERRLCETNLPGKE
jgi:lysozyme